MKKQFFKKHVAPDPNFCTCGVCQLHRTFCHSNGNFGSKGGTGNGCSPVEVARKTHSKCSWNHPPSPLVRGQGRHWNYINGPMETNFSCKEWIQILGASCFYCFWSLAACRSSLSANMVFSTEFWRFDGLPFLAFCLLTLFTDSNRALLPEPLGWRNGRSINTSHRRRNKSFDFSSTLHRDRTGRVGWDDHQHGKRLPELCQVEHTREPCGNCGKRCNSNIGRERSVCKVTSAQERLCPSFFREKKCCLPFRHSDCRFACSFLPRCG